MERRDLLKASLLGLVPAAAAGRSAASTGSKPASGGIDSFETAAKYPMVDSHLHYLDFLQQTDGLKRLTEAMDSCGVARAVMFGMPMVKQWDANMPRPTYYMSNDSRCYHYSATDYLYLKLLSDAPEDVRRRFIAFVCGVNINDMMAEHYLRRLFDEFPDMIKGIGEIMSRHDDLTAYTYGEPPRADHPALMKIYDLAVEKHVPVLIHHNIAPSYGKEPLYLAEMLRGLKYNRKANVIWAHVGVSRRVELANLREIAESVLKDNKNLYFDISWLVFEDYIAKSEKTLDQWAALIKKYPDRFMIGTDVVGHWKTYKANVEKYYPLLDRLPKEAAAMLSHGNILRLCHL